MFGPKAVKKLIHAFLFWRWNNWEQEGYPPRPRMAQVYFFTPLQHPNFRTFEFCGSTTTLSNGLTCTSVFQGWSKARRKIRIRTTRRFLWPWAPLPFAKWIAFGWNQTPRTTGKSWFVLVLFFLPQFSPKVKSAGVKPTETAIVPARPDEDCSGGSQGCHLRGCGESRRQGWYVTCDGYVCLYMLYTLSGRLVHRCFVMFVLENCGITPIQVATLATYTRIVWKPRWSRRTDRV